MRQFLIFIQLIIITQLISSCAQDLTAEIPSYIEINNFDYLGNNSTTTPHPGGYENYNPINVTDVWISMNGNTIGTFEIPCKIPILDEGIHSFDIYPGIKVNGISGTRIKYPFYEKYELDTELSKEEIVEISPKTSYKEETMFYFEEKGQFEVGGTMFEKSFNSDTSKIIQNEVVFQGTHSAAIYLDSTNTYFDVRNIEELELQNNTFLELNFLSSIDLNVGLIIFNNNDVEDKQELIQLYPTNDWKKIYLDLSPIISMGTPSSKFKIYFEGMYDTNQNINATYLDNLKLVFSK